MHILVYCQHVLGIGHLVRTFEILKALKGHQITLLLGGSATSLPVPEHVERVQLPALMMDHTFSTLSTDTGESLDRVKKERQAIIRRTIARVRPEICLIELYPFGRNSFHFEIAPLLEQIQQKHPACLTCSSVRDILVDRDNKEKFERRAIERLNTFFDLLLIHSDPQVLTLDMTFGRMEDITIPVAYTGYVHRPPQERSPRGNRQYPRIVASAGGGSVGYQLLEAVVKAHALLSNHLRCSLQLFTGPYLETGGKKTLKSLAAPHAQIEDFCPNLPARLHHADLSISMGGYNTTMDVLAAGCPALIHPFKQNHEQRLRAQKLQQLAPIFILDEPDLDPPHLAQKIQTALRTPRRAVQPVRLDGAQTTARLLVQAAQQKQSRP